MIVNSRILPALAAMAAYAPARPNRKIHTQFALLQN
jgi:hypothetical protein